MKPIHNLFRLALACAALCCACSLGKLDPNEVKLTDHADARVVGVWLSTGSNIAPYVKANARIVVDSLFLTFNQDYTYVEKQVSKTGATSVSSGTYSVSSSFFEGIWSATLKQTTPTVATLAGIYSIEGANLKLEVIQIEPGAHSAATPIDGFGSTDLGRLGESNIQKYVRFK